MKKHPAETQYPIHELVEARWSPRAFTGENLPESDLRSVLEAARWAASCFNEQPWAYIVATRDDGEAFEKALLGLNEKNRAWAKDAGAVLFAVAKKTFDHNGKPNRHAWHDVGAANAQLTVEATARGLGVHQMAGIERDVIVEQYGVPDDWEVVDGLVVGKTQPDEETKPRRRKPQSDFVFTGGWGQSRA